MTYFPDVVCGKTCGLSYIDEVIPSQRHMVIGCSTYNHLTLYFMTVSLEW